MSVLLFLLYVQQIPEVVAMWRLQIKRVRFLHWNFFFFFTPFFFSVSFFSPFFFLHARSAISMLKHFSSLHVLVYILTKSELLVTCILGNINTNIKVDSLSWMHCIIFFFCLTTSLYSAIFNHSVLFLVSLLISWFTNTLHYVAACWSYLGAKETTESIFCTKRNG